MGDPAISCDDERLRLLLAGELSPALEQQTTDHLAGCPQCRRRLELLAGAPAWWTEVETGLRRCAGRLATDSRHGHVVPGEAAADDDRQPAEGAGKRTEGVSFVADFAVDFLEPSAQAGTMGRLGTIDILDVIGRGGMGIVLKGRQRELGRYVAVKVLSPHLAASGSARARFAREARAAAAVVHPHVMAIHSVHVSGRLPYLVMPYLACESLQQRLDRDGPLELKQVLRIAHQIAAGLAAAHAQGLVHRDIKPANILLEEGVDRVLLTDFGLARAVDDASLTRTGVIAGTPQYMSPEQAYGSVIDERSDLFSLGSVLYAMCTGRPPFRAETSYGILRRITDSHPRAVSQINPDVPGWLDAIVGKLLAKKPADRFRAAAAVAELLAGCLAHVQQPAAVALPAACQDLPPAAREGEVLPPIEARVLRDRSLDGRIRHAVVRLLRSRPRTAKAVLAGGVAAAMLAAALVLPRHPLNQAPPPVGGRSDETPSQTDVSVIGETALEAVDTQWHSTARAIDTLYRDGAAFESEIERFWEPTWESSGNSSLHSPVQER